MIPLIVRIACGLAAIGIVVALVLYLGRTVEQRQYVYDIRPEDLEGIQGNKIVLFYDSSCKTNKDIRDRLQTQCKSVDNLVFCAMDCSQHAKEGSVAASVGMVPTLAVVSNGGKEMLHKTLTSLPSVQQDVVEAQRIAKLV